MSQWAGWWAPSADDIARLHALFDRETNKNPPIFSLKLGPWLAIGESPLRPYISQRVPNVNPRVGPSMALPMSALSVQDPTIAHAIEDHEMMDAGPSV